MRDWLKRFGDWVSELLGVTGKFERDDYEEDFPMLASDHCFIGDRSDESSSDGAWEGSSEYPCPPDVCAKMMKETGEKRCLGCRGDERKNHDLDD